MLLNCDVGEDSWESLGPQGGPTSPSSRRSVLNIHWKDWCWSWNSSTLATWCEELTYLKRPWCWDRLKVGGEGDDRGWDGWMEPQWTWVWVNSGSWWWTGRPGVLQSMGSQRVGLNWLTDDRALTLVRDHSRSFMYVTITSLYSNYLGTNSCLQTTSLSRVISILYITQPPNLYLYPLIQYMTLHNHSKTRNLGVISLITNQI